MAGRAEIAYAARMAEPFHRTESPASLRAAGWLLLGEATTPDGAELQLWQRAEDFSIRLGDGRELMSNRAHGSEEALARYGCADLRQAAAPRVLIGGLGLGYTLAAALRILPPSATVVVAELLPEVVTWNRGPLAQLAGHPLDDPRVEIVVGDVAELWQRPVQAFDAILLDVDNGPRSLCRPENERLYTASGVAAVLPALAGEGILIVWSADEAPEFVERVREAGLVVETRQPRARGGKRGARHTLFLIRRRWPENGIPTGR